MDEYRLVIPKDYPAFKWAGQEVENFWIENKTLRFLASSFKAAIGQWVVIDDDGNPHAYDEREFKQKYLPKRIDFEKDEIIDHLREELQVMERAVLELGSHFKLGFFYECNKPGVFGWWWEYGERGSEEFIQLEGDYIDDLHDCVRDFFKTVGFNGKYYLPSK
jgi:hypothetical protein